jgi:RimJ/RimL family protein N-acetyltransferase
MNATAFLSGKKTILRPLSASDAPLFMKWMNDEKTRKFLLTRVPVTEAAEKSWIEKNLALEQYPTSIIFVIETKDGTTIGNIGLRNINWIDRNATTGTIIGEEEYRGKGYATDAKMVLLQYAFEVLGLHKIISHAFSANKKSIAYSKRCGYVVEAVNKKHIYSNGKWVDMTTLACFYKGWKKANKKR